MTARYLILYKVSPSKAVIVAKKIQLPISGFFNFCPFNLIFANLSDILVFCQMPTHQAGHDIYCVMYISNAQLKLCRPILKARIIADCDIGCDCDRSRIKFWWKLIILIPYFSHYLRINVVIRVLEIICRNRAHILFYFSL